MPADKKTATPPKIGTCKECDFLAEGVSVKFLAVASLWKKGTKIIDSMIENNSPQSI